MVGCAPHKNLKDIEEVSPETSKMNGTRMGYVVL
jgi:hypothetical protein